MAVGASKQLFTSFWVWFEHCHLNMTQMTSPSFSSLFRSLRRAFGSSVWVATFQALHHFLFASDYFCDVTPFRRLPSEMKRFEKAYKKFHSVIVCCLFNHSHASTARCHAGAVTWHELIDTWWTMSSLKDFTLSNTDILLVYERINILINFRCPQKLLRLPFRLS